MRQHSLESLEGSSTNALTCKTGKYQATVQLANHMSKYKTTNEYFGAIMTEGIHASQWFRTAPPDAQATAKIKILGIENRSYSSMIHTTARPALIAECECGGEVQRFSLLLDNTTRVQAVD